MKIPPGRVEVEGKLLTEILKEGMERVRLVKTAVRLSHLHSVLLNPRVLYKAKN